MTLFGGMLIVFAVYLSLQIRTLLGLLRLLRTPPPPESPPLPLSVIIAAHNEEETIGRCLDALMRQNYPAETFEIVVALDRCHDRTKEIVEAYRAKFSALKTIDVIEVPPGVSPKKHALSKAIDAARFDHFVFLDADVEPHPDHLVVFSRYLSDAEVVVSLMKFHPPQSIWQEFLLFEKLISWCIAGAAIGNQKPFLSYGGNWAYSRRAFQAAGGFASIAHSLSGDDDLLLQQMAAAGMSCRMCLDPQGWIRTAPPSSWVGFLRQRRRHFSAGKYYRLPVKIGYFLLHVTNLLLWLMPLFFFPALALLAAKIIGDLMILKSGSKLFRESFPPHKSLLFNFLYMAYNTLIGPLGYLGKIRW